MLIRRAMLALVAMSALSVAGSPPGKVQPEPPWVNGLRSKLALYGHRNWIVIADAAYPAQSKSGITTNLSGAEHVDVVKILLDELAKVKHVRPVVYLDAELPKVSERDAPGIGEYRNSLKKLLGSHKPIAVPHEKLIERLDKAGDLFQVLVVKTTLTLPYTSVFIELDCGYWTPEAEKRLRNAMEANGGQ